MTNEMQETGGQEPSSLPALHHPAEAVLRLRYFAYSAVPGTILLDYMSQGQLGPSIAIGAALGGAAAYFAPEIHKIFQPAVRSAGDVWAYLNRNHAGRARHRLVDIHWWLTGEPTIFYAEDEDWEPGDDGGVDQEEDEDTAPSRTQKEPCLYLGAMLQPRAKGLLSMRLGMFGIPGSGKSNGVRVFVEELGKLAGVGVPFVLGDTEAEYAALCNLKYLMRPFPANASNVTPENAFAFGQQVLDEGLQVVLDLQSYDTDDDAALVMVEIIRGLRVWEEAHRNDERATCMFILDEAATWLPQNVKESALSKEVDEQGHTLLAKLQRAVFDTAVRRGRKRGIGFMFATQRPADIDKRVTSCNWFLLFKQTFPNDLQIYKELGVDADIAQALAPGEAFVIDPQGGRAPYQFRTSHSPDLSKSPGVESLHFHARRWEKTAGYAPTVRAMRPPVETDQGIYGQEISRARVEEPSPTRQNMEFELEDLPTHEPTRARAESFDAPVESAHEEKDDARGKYRLSIEQSAQFRAIYPDYDANIDRVLKKIGANSNYRAHANEIIKEYGLVKASNNK